jgi:hypothetical protein
LDGALGVLLSITEERERNHPICYPSIMHKVFRKPVPELLLGYMFLVTDVFEG